MWMGKGLAEGRKNLRNDDLRNVLFSMDVNMFYFVVLT